jgi:uncharacterized protein YndB with AHSA1/START domain
VAASLRGSLGVRMALDIRKQITVKAPIARVWAALTNPAAIGAWMEDDEVVVELKPGGRIALFGGATTGLVRLFTVPTALAYTWRQAEWPAKWPDSLVVWELAKDGRSATRLRLRHSKLPNQSERDSHDEGWDVYWLGPMVAHLEA